MRIAESELIINADGSIFHLHIRPEQLAKKIVLVGDPGRVAFFTPLFDVVECEGASREFVWATGVYKGERITALSTGIGTDNIDIVMTELDALANVDFSTREVKSEHTTLTIVRVGTCGALQPEIPLGSFILSHYSIGFDGLLNWYADRDEITNTDMEEAFMKHMNWPRPLPIPYFAHASQRLIDLFADSTEDVESFRYGDWKITNFEMEGSAIAGIAGHLGHDAITVCCAIAHRYLKDANTDYKPLVKKLIHLTLDKLSEL